MNSSQLGAILQQQKWNLEAAKARKGQRATNKPSRAQLEFNVHRMAVSIVIIYTAALYTNDSTARRKK